MKKYVLASAMAGLSMIAAVPAYADDGFIGATFGRIDVGVGDADSWGIHGATNFNAGSGMRFLIDGSFTDSNDVDVQSLVGTGHLVWDDVVAKIGERTKVVAVTQMSNVLGTINPVREMIAAAHKRGIPVLVDGAQAAPHMRLDMQALDCDFYAFSGHKMFGPTGIGVLYGKAAWLEKMQPYKGGGDMILSVTFEKTVYNVIPGKFEAGTPPIAAAVTLGAAADYMGSIGMEAIHAHETDLLDYATDQVNRLPGVRIIGTAERKAAVLSFVVEGVHPHDVGTLLNEEGIAVRTGHHCAQPIMQRFGIPATSRASFAFYNTHAEVDALVAGIRKVQKTLG
jgi:cysteine desulfurase/selenocysteine lyase